MSLRHAFTVGAVLLATVSLSACDSAEDRAEEHYQSALALIEDGDVERALIELRNVLSLNNQRNDARLVYAQQARSIGNIPESYSQYLQIAEQSPNDIQARIALTEMAILAQNWEEAERHGRALAELGDSSIEAQIVELALEFREAALAEDGPAIDAIISRGEDLYAERGDSEILQLILVEGYTRQGSNSSALAVINDAIETNPQARRFYGMKTGILASLQDIDGLEAHLRDMVAAFPEDAETQATLVRVLARTGKLDSAEEFIRDQLATADDKPQRHIGLITFLRQTKGDDAALEEIETAINAYEDNGLFLALRGGILFDRGQEDAAVAEMEAAIAGTQDSILQNRFKVTLARMLANAGNDVGARQLVEEVLASDPNQVEALKMSAEWQIEADQTDDAISALTSALDQAPEDSEAMTLLARAHQRNGNPELAQDLLSLAVEASGNAPAESLRFARLLIGQEQFRSAEDTLIAALRASPDNPALLALLGDVYLQSDDFPRASQVESTLRRLDTDETRQIADRLKLQILNRRDGQDQAVAFLEQLASQEGATAAKATLLRQRVSTGDAEGALALADELIAENPNNPRLSLVKGNTYVALRDFESAETEFQRVTDENSANIGAWLQLARIQSAQGNGDEARQTVDAGLEANPEAGNLLWAKASFLEQANDVDGAIGIYESLYERSPNSLIIANNLASLLATYREDDESLERAYTVARRLQGTTTAPFQDTIGWILFRRGDVTEALTYLEPAAEALSSDPIVQYHLARAYLGAERPEDALAAFKRAVEAADEGDPRPQIEEARAEIERLEQ